MGSHKLLQTEEKAQAVDYRDEGVTWRILIICFLIAPLNAYFMAHLQGPRGLEGPTVVSLFYNVVFVLVIFRGMNALLTRWAPRVAFSPAELLSFFILLSVATCTSGQDTMNTMFGTIHGWAHFATPENGWEDLFWRFVPHGMTVSDKVALRRLWDGDSSIFQPHNLSVWLGPMLRWWLFFTALWSAPVGLAVLFRRRWVEAEKMSFPIVQLPYELSRRVTQLPLRPAFWIAIGITWTINLLNGLHQFYPGVPVIAVKLWQSPTINLAKYFVGRPWNAIGTFQTCLYPFIIGLGILLPQELSLSLWFFYLFWKVEAIFCAWMGWTQTPEFPYMKEQSWGGYLALLGFSLWAARPYFRQVMRRISGLEKPAVDAEEPLRYRTSALIFLAGFLYVTAVGVSQKMSVPVSVAFFAQYYIMTLIIGRIRAEMGLPTHELERLGPTVMQGNVLGPRILGTQNLTSLSVFFSFTRGMRNIPFPHQVEGLYFAYRTGLNGRRLLLATIGMIAFAQAWALFWFLYLGYHHGLGSDWAPWFPWVPQEAWRQLAGWLHADHGFAWGRVIASAIGFAFYFGMMVIRTRFIWWPLHPAGFALGTTWYMAHMWFPMFVAWLLKSIVTRYMGPRAVPGLMAFAFGLILGDITSGCLWVVYALIFQVQTYSFWP